MKLIRFFHVSYDKGLDGNVINPRIPKSRMKSEEYTTPRVCVSDSINGCLTAVSRYKKGEVITVYECFSDKFIQPTEKQVIDAPLTGECWILEPIVLNYFATIKITKVVESKINEMMNNLYAFEFLEKNSS